MDYVTDHNESLNGRLSLAENGIGSLPILGRVALSVTFRNVTKTGKRSPVQSRQRCETENRSLIRIPLVSTAISGRKFKMADIGVTGAILLPKIISGGVFQDGTMNHVLSNRSSKFFKCINATYK